MEAGVCQAADLREMGFPVWSRAICAPRSVKATPGSVNVPVVFGEMAIDPGEPGLDFYGLRASW